MHNLISQSILFLKKLYKKVKWSFFVVSRCCFKSKEASDSPVMDMLSPVPPGDWYMPRSTKVVKEDLPDALTKPLDWYWWEQRRSMNNTLLFNSTPCWWRFKSDKLLKIYIFDDPLTNWTGCHKIQSVVGGCHGRNDDIYGTHKNKLEI